MLRNILSVQGLKVHFYTLREEVRAVDGIDLNIHEGGAVGLVGESGCGKTVTALSIMRVVPRPGQIISGKIMLKDTNLLELSQDEMKRIRGREISMVFQDPFTFLNPVIRVGDQIAEAIALHQKVSKKEIDAKVIESLRLVQMPSPERTRRLYPHQLSGGMRQRVLIAMAISCNPSLLIADEPTTALDVTVQARLLQLMAELIERLKLSLLLITHDLGIVSQLCDRVYVMYAGKIVENADVFSLYGNPKHPYTVGLLKSAPTITEHKKTFFTIAGTVPDLINLPKGCRFHPRCVEARTKCKQNEPQLVEVEDGHFVACWLNG